MGRMPWPVRAAFIAGFCISLLCAFTLSGQAERALEMLFAQGYFKAFGTVDVSLPPFNADPTGTNDSTAAIQAVVDTGVGALSFDGTFKVCALIPRAGSQKWRGSGQGTTRLVGPAGCASVILNSPPSPPQQGPVLNWTIEDMTLEGANTNLINLNGRDQAVARINRVDFDVAGAAGDVDGTNGIQAAGVRVLMDGANCYSSHPGFGQCVILTRGANRSLITRSTMKWVALGVMPGATGNVGTSETVDGLQFLENFIDLGWWALPQIFQGIDAANCTAAGVPVACCTGSGTGTGFCAASHVTYGATTLTDSSASFTGLCNGTGSPGTCTSGQGANVRVLTTKATTDRSVTFFKGGEISNAGKNWVSLGAQEGDLARTTERFCTGYGTGQSVTTRFTGVVGTSDCTTASQPYTATLGNFGDRCPCTANTDCKSGKCEYRFATVLNANTTTTTDLVIDEWTADGDGLGGSIAATRRPTGAPPDGALVNIYGWVIGEVGSYTSTVITLAGKTQGWVGWDGTAATPSAGAMYEILPKHPNYAFEGMQSLKNAIIAYNYVTRGWSDCLNNFGTESVFMGNVVTNCQDHCYNVQGARNTFSGNRGRHCGARGAGFFCDDSSITGNVMSDTPWINNTNTISLGDYFVSGSRNVFVGNRAQQTLPVNSNRYGFVIASSGGGTPDSNIIDDQNFQGTYDNGQYRIDGPAATKTHIRNWNGETISQSLPADCTGSGAPEACCTGSGTGPTCDDGTYFIEGGMATEAQVVAPPTLPQNGSYVGCSNCTADADCAPSGGTGGFARWLGGAVTCP